MAAALGAPAHVADAELRAKAAASKDPADPVKVKVKTLPKRPAVAMMPQIKQMRMDAQTHTMCGPMVEFEPTAHCTLGMSVKRELELSLHGAIAAAATAMPICAPPATSGLSASSGPMMMQMHHHHHVPVVNAGIIAKAEGLMAKAEGIIAKAEIQQEEPRKRRSRLGEQRFPGRWGPFWRYDQCTHHATRAGNTTQEPLIPNWPEGIVRITGKKIFWLPEGWGQGEKKTAGGKTLKVYVDTEGRVFYHKADVESAYKVKLPDKDPKRKAGAFDLKTARPSWPPGEWLPRDWYVCYKQLSNRCVKCFVTPDQSGFAYHKFTVIDYLNGKGKLTSVDRRILKLGVDKMAMEKTLTYPES